MTEYKVMSWENTPLGVGRPEPCSRLSKFTGYQAEDVVTHQSAGSQWEHEGEKDLPKHPSWSLNYLILGF